MGRSTVHRAFAEASEAERAVLEGARLLTAALRDMNAAQRSAARWKRLAKKLRKESAVLRADLAATNKLRAELLATTAELAAANQVGPEVMAERNDALLRVQELEAALDVVTVKLRLVIANVVKVFERLAK
jgi:hypothetical protein